MVKTIKNLLIMLSVTDTLKTVSKRTTPKTAEATSDLIGNKISDRNVKISKTSQQNNSGTVKNEDDKEIPKEIYIYIYPEERQKLLMTWD